jgi:hypothetical protein
MSRGKKGMSERAIERLEEKGYLKSIRAEMRAEVLKCLVDMEEEGLIPADLRIKRFSPVDPEDTEALAYVLQFLAHHGMTQTKNCLLNEVNAEIPFRPVNSQRSDIAALISARAEADDEDDEDQE